MTKQELIPAAPNMQHWEDKQRMAKAYSQADFAGERFRNNLPNCLYAMDYASRLDLPIGEVMAGLYVVHNKPSFSAKFKIARFNELGKFSTIKYEFLGTEGEEDRACRAWTTELATGERIEGTWITFAMAKAEGWVSKRGSKWQSMPEQMFRYRAASFLIDTTAPGCVCGLPTADDLRSYPPGTTTVRTVDDILQGKEAENGALFDKGHAATD